MKEQIFAMLNELRPEFDFNDSNDFAMDGLLDSYDIISLCNMIEEKYEIKIDGIDLVPENFASFETIEALIKKSGGSK